MSRLVGLIAVGVIANAPVLAQKQDPFELRDDNARCAVNQLVAINLYANDAFNGLNTAFLDLQVGEPEHGVVVLGQLPGEVIYFAQPGFEGSDSFPYTVLDIQSGFEDTATVRIQVLDAANLVGAFIFADQVCDANRQLCSLVALPVIANNGTLCGCEAAVQIYLSQDDRLSADDRKIGRFITRPIGPVQLDQYDFARRLKRGQSVEGQFLIMRVDYNNRLFELDERDNVSRAIQIGPAGRSCKRPELSLDGGLIRVSGCEGVIEVELSR